MTLKEQAEELSTHLQIAGIDIEPRDLLDALAMAGLTLVPDPIQESSYTYLESLQDE